MPDPIRIGLRVLSNPGWRGGINYVINWAHALAGLPPTERPEVVLLFTDDAGQAIADGLRSVVSDIRPFTEAASLNLDLVYPATHVLEAPVGAPWAGWVLDWQHKHLPEMFDDAERARRDVHYPFMAERAPVIVASSDAGIADLIAACGTRTAPRVRLRFPALLSELCPPEEISDARQRYGLPERYVIVCNQWWKHKNNDVVVDALMACREPVFCVFTGATGDERWPDYFEGIMRRAEANGGSKRMAVLGSVPRRDQVLLLEGAHAIVQPSLFEGWSTLVEEARVLRKMIVLSRLPVHLEQAPPLARFFDPHNAAELAEALDGFWQLPPPLPPSEQDRAEHMAYVAECARALIGAARLARRQWRPGLHDPAVLTPDLLERCDRVADESIAKRLKKSILTAGRVTLRSNPEALRSAMQSSAKCSTANSELMRAELEVPLLAKLTALQRAAYLVGEKRTLKARVRQSLRLSASRLKNAAKSLIGGQP